MTDEHISDEQFTAAVTEVAEAKWAAAGTLEIWDAAPDYLRQGALNAPAHELVDEIAKLSGDGVWLGSDLVNRAVEQIVGRYRASMG